MPTTPIRVDNDLLQRIEQVKPSFLSTTAFFQLLANDALNAQFDKNPLSPLTIPPYPTLPQTEQSQSSKGVERENDNERKRVVVSGREGVELSLQAEEAHIEPAALEAVKRKPTTIRDIPPNLICHDDLIEACWKAKPKTKTQAAWNLLIGELTRMQERYGDSVLRDQLKLAEANRWQGVTVRNYEQFGMDKPKTPTRGHVMDFDWESINGMSI